MMRRPDQPSIKAKIASLPDQTIVNMVEKYAEYLKTRVQKTCKQIANKCFEAVTIVKSRKATGYGRSPMEAATHSIRKLAEAITEDEQALKFLEESFEKYSTAQDLDVTNHTDYKNADQRDVSKENYPHFAIEQQKIDLKSKNPFTNKGNSISKSAMKVSTKKDLCDSPNIEDTSQKVRPNNFLYIMPQNAMEPTSEQQLKKAYAYIQKLEAQLKCFSAQNKYLKEIIGVKVQTRKGRIQTQIPNLAIELSSKKINLQRDRSNSKFKSVNSNYASIDAAKNRSFIEEEVDNSFTQEKKKIPKLNLKILPNYHGNSNKSLNQSLLLAYEKLKKK